jgi:carbon storage regulator
MLVLTRRPGEAIVIGDEIEVTVTAIAGGKVRLGVQAPRHITVDRREIHDAKLAERHHPAQRKAA